MLRVSAAISSLVAFMTPASTKPSQIVAAVLILRSRMRRK